MKNRHHHSLLLAAAVLCVAGIAGAAQPELRMPQQLKPGIQVNPSVIAQLNPCPQGWKLAWRNSASGAFMCEPKPVRRLDCPDGTTFTTQGSCAVGCGEIIY